MQPDQIVVSDIRVICLYNMTKYWSQIQWGRERAFASTRLQVMNLPFPLLPVPFALYCCRICLRWCLSDGCGPERGRRVERQKHMEQIKFEKTIHCKFTFANEPLMTHPQDIIVWSHDNTGLLDAVEVAISAKTSLATACCLNAEDIHQTWTSK